MSEKPDWRLICWYCGEPIEKDEKVVVSLTDNRVAHAKCDEEGAV